MLIHVERKSSTSKEGCNSTTRKDGGADPLYLSGWIHKSGLSCDNGLKMQHPAFLEFYNFSLPFVILLFFFFCKCTVSKAHDSNMGHAHARKVFRPGVAGAGVFRAMRAAERSGGMRRRELQRVQTRGEEAEPPQSRLC